MTGWPTVTLSNEAPLHMLSPEACQGIKIPSRAVGVGFCGNELILEFPTKSMPPLHGAPLDFEKLFEPRGLVRPFHLHLGAARPEEGVEPVLRQTFHRLAHLLRRHAQGGAPIDGMSGGEPARPL